MTITEAFKKRIVNFPWGKYNLNDVWYAEAEEWAEDLAEEMRLALLEWESRPINSFSPGDPC